MQNSYCIGAIFHQIQRYKTPYFLVLKNLGIEFGNIPYADGSCILNKTKIELTKLLMKAY